MALACHSRMRSEGLEDPACQRTPTALESRNDKRSDPDGGYAAGLVPMGPNPWKVSPSGRSPEGSSCVRTLVPDRSGIAALAAHRTSVESHAAAAASGGSQPGFDPAADRRGRDAVAIVQGRQRAGIEERVGQARSGGTSGGRPAQQQRRATASPRPPITVWFSATTTSRPPRAGLPQDRLHVERLDGRHVQHGDVDPVVREQLRPPPAPAWS